MNTTRFPYAQTAHEGTSSVKKAKINNLNMQYKLFRMKEGETI